MPFHKDKNPSSLIIFFNVSIAPIDFTVVGSASLAKETLAEQRVYQIVIYIYIY